METTFKPQVSKYWFLTSTRFYASVLGCVTIAYGGDGIATGPEIYNALVSLAGLFIGLKSIHNAEALHTLQNTTTIEQLTMSPSKPTNIIVAIIAAAAVIVILYVLNSGKPLPPPPPVVEAPVAAEVVTPVVPVEGQPPTTTVVTPVTVTE